MNPAVFVDPYYSAIVAAVIARLKAGAGSNPQFEVVEYAGELEGPEGVLRFASRVKMQPVILVRFLGGASSARDSMHTLDSERVSFEVIVGVHNPRSITEAFSTAMGGVGYARKQLVGFRVEGTEDMTNSAPIKYDSWSTVASDTPMTVLAVNFFVDLHVALDEA